MDTAKSFATTDPVEAPPPDELPATPDERREGLLLSAKRTMVPIRRAFVQQPRSSDNRAATLSDLVSSRQEHAFDAYLLLLALEPILEKTPLPASVWGELLSPNAGPFISAASVSKTWTTLSKLKLVERHTRIKRLADVRPLHESGSGKAYTRPGLDPKGTSTGHFWLPHEYWTTGLHLQLGLPAKAMLLIWLSATGQEPTFAMSYEQTTPWYGLSERTAERGIGQLEQLGLMTTSVATVKSLRSPTGKTVRYHRKLTGPFSYSARLAAHGQMVTQTRSRRAPAAGPTEGGEHDPTPEAQALVVNQA